MQLFIKRHPVEDVVYLLPGEVWAAQIFRYKTKTLKNTVKGKELTRCDEVRTFIASTCFGHQYAHHHKYN
jgi:hypothetical protein